MNHGFWQTLKKPIMALAPLHDVTDTVFRRLIAEKGKPDMMFTEFASVDGLTHERSREKMIWRYLTFTEPERPLVAQIWGTDPSKFEHVARLVVDLGFDGIDINMGCPEKSAVKHGACSALINTPELAQDIIRATMRGAGNLPVSVKTRIGFNKNVIDEWMKYLLETEPAVITVHGRTAKQMSKVPADWDSIGKAVELAADTDTLVLGNGDVLTLTAAEEKAKQYGVDGVVFGRAIFVNHWLFDRTRTSLPTTEEKLDALVRHAELYERVFDNQRNFSVLKKHFKTYTLGIRGGKELRIALMDTHDAQSVKQIVESWKKNNAV